MIKIKPITLGLPPKQANQLFVRPIINSTSDVSCNTYYEVSTEEGETLANGNCPISEEQYALWADDNTYIEDIVIAFLGLQRA
jgi:hypothetical protein